jgi:hypothetical protein
MQDAVRDAQTLLLSISYRDPWGFSPYTTSFSQDSGFSHPLGADEVGVYVCCGCMRTRSCLAMQLSYLARTCYERLESRQRKGLQIEAERQERVWHSTEIAMISALESRPHQSPGGTYLISKWTTGPTRDGQLTTLIRRLCGLAPALRWY